MHDAVMAGDGSAAGAIVHYHATWSIDLIQKRTQDIELRARTPACWKPASTVWR
jgi:hypothetical protein